LQHALLRLALEWLTALAGPALAHKSSDAYLFVDTTSQGTTLRADVALRDLDAALNLDNDGNEKLTWGEVKAARPAIESYLLSGISLYGCTLRVQDFGLEQRADGVYAATRFGASCSNGWVVQANPIRYTLFAAIDPTHRAIARMQDGANAPVLRLLDPGQPQPPPVLQTSAAEVPTAASNNPVALAPAPHAESFIQEGVRHILGGFDHVLFLVCLLRPAVMVRDVSGARRQWLPVKSLGQALLPILGIVTMFTLARSITLALSAFGLVSLPSAIIEPAIALTIILTAVDNIRPIFRLPRAAITFLFGLIHGFGFAGVLAELDLPAKEFAWALLQFNIGLEIGQLALVVLAMALLYLLRQQPAYPRWVIAGGSSAAALVGVWWFAERIGALGALAS